MHFFPVCLRVVNHELIVLYVAHSNLYPWNESNKSEKVGNESQQLQVRGVWKTGQVMVAGLRRLRKMLFCFGTVDARYYIVTTCNYMLLHVSTILSCCDGKVRQLRLRGCWFLLLRCAWLVHDRVDHFIESLWMCQVQAPPHTSFLKRKMC